MEATAPPLKDLRAEIDRIDETILDLFIERSVVVRQIGDVKGDRLDGRLALRPAREAQILRRLAEVARGRFPSAVLVRMWRELLAAQTRLQTPISVAVFAPQHSLRIWDLARDHFGSITPMIRVDSASQAVRAVSNRTAAIAVLPLPSDDDPWWISLMSDHQPRLRVFARLPFVAAGAGEGEDVSGLALGPLEPEPSGDDLALLAIEAEPGVSRGRLRNLMDAAGLVPVWLAAWRPKDLPQALHLVETESFVGEWDERVAGVLKAARGEVLRVVPVGGYARPLPPD